MLPLHARLVVTTAVLLSCGAGDDFVFILFTYLFFCQIIKSLLAQIVCLSCMTYVP